MLKAIRNSVSSILEVGGGIRSEADVEELLEIGIDRLIVGTVLAKDHVNNKKVLIQDQMF